MIQPISVLFIRVVQGFKRITDPDPRRPLNHFPSPSRYKTLSCTFPSLRVTRIYAYIYDACRQRDIFVPHANNVRARSHGWQG
ncbi:uncharacterized protein [Physcomitrium patens]|uniref:uncharacterized protein n=1 Tax=Physcomitrium patens TaxID=3218 RepID=UPI003CCCB5E9